MCVSVCGVRCVARWYARCTNDVNRYTDVCRLLVLPQKDDESKLALPALISVSVGVVGWSCRFKADFYENSVGRSRRIKGGEIKLIRSIDKNQLNFGVAYLSVRSSSTARTPTSTATWRSRRPSGSACNISNQALLLRAFPFAVAL